MARTSSGITTFQPAMADLVIECFERLQIMGNELKPEHVISARRKANLLLTGDWSTRGVNLWKMELVTVALQPGQPTYRMPRGTVNVFDAYRRTYTGGASGSFVNVGNTLTPMLSGAGVPMITSNGEPMVLSPGSQTLTAVTGAVMMTMHWPLHRLQQGSQFFWGMPTEVGGVVLTDSSIVQSVIDDDNFVFVAPSPALWDATLQGAPPLFASTAGSNLVDCLLPQHGYLPGGTFTVQENTLVGGLTVPVGNYEVLSVPTNYQFSFNPDNGEASDTTAEFENNGQIWVSTTRPQPAQFTDIYLWPISRNEYAMLPNKRQPGPPSQYWLDRQIIPVLNVWPVPEQGSSYAFIAYRMVQIDDANPVSGQILDLPNRFLPCFCADLTASLAETYKPAQWKDKLQYAMALWDYIAKDDKEYVSSFIAGDISGYFR